MYGMNNKVNNFPVVEILWTGGFDSTFRVTELSLLPVVIQPYYLSDNRQSEPNELNAIKQITKNLCTRSATKAVFRPLIIISKAERVQDNLISAAYKRTRATDFFGSQYDWLGRFATEHKGIELSIHHDDKAIELINKYGAIKKIEIPTIGTNYILDQDKSPEDLNTLFRNYHLPLAMITKIQMREWYRTHHYEDVMNLTWFCYSPINGEPCGKCNPCTYTIEEGLTERFTRGGLRRYHIKKGIRGIKNLVKAIIR